MNTLFSKTKEELKTKKGLVTAEEIAQQPQVWQKTFSLIQDRKDELAAFIDQVLAEDRIRIIFSGAGSSGYIGDTVVPYLKKIMPEVEIESAHTTDIVAQPELYLTKNIPTLLFSYARSGNSPESLATVELAEKLVDNLYQIIITCNQDGGLAKNAEGEKTKLILLPEKAHDQGFAMTSSFSSMIFATLLLFNLKEIDDLSGDIEIIAENARNLIEKDDLLPKLAAKDFKKIVYLGTYGYFGLAKEAALKLLELTAGQIITRYDSPLGFRHGPKSIIDDQTLVILFYSADQYSSKYDYDLLKELSHQQGDFETLVIAAEDKPELREMSDNFISLAEKTEKADEIYNALDYLVAAQVLSLLYSLKYGITPDDPSPSGDVNRVVEGVTIYPYQ